MITLESLDALFVLWAFLFQVILIVHFSLRKWFFDVTIRYGWIVYALSVPAVVVRLILLVGGKAWSLWLGGFIYLAWAIFGYTVEYVRKIEWREPILLPVFGPYILLYLATVMFYWWPLALIDRRLWYAYALLFVASTALNVTSHNGSKGNSCLH